MKYLSLIILLLLSGQLFSQEKPAEKSESPDFYITQDGEKVFMYGSISMSAQYLQYENEKGKSKQYAQKKIKLMVAKGRLFINLPIGGIMDRMHEIVAFNDSHFLSYYLGEDIYYIFDRQNKIVESRLTFNGRDADGKIEKYYKKIAPYFPGCKELHDYVTNNLNEHKKLSEGVTYYKCGDKDFFEMVSK